MLLLGIDIGTSSIKVSVVDGATRRTIASAQYPETEAEIISLQPGWAEQSPQQWWDDVKQAIKKVNSLGHYNPGDIEAIGISYQMHGLVLLDKKGDILRNSIIWCDSRAVPYGEAAFQNIGEEKCLRTLLNSPGNFTASKLAWVKAKEPQVYERIDKIMLPGDFIAYRLTGKTTTSAAALSEGIFWDFQKDEISEDVLKYFGFNKSIIPYVEKVFAEHGRLSRDVAKELFFKEGIPITYKAGDQPNNALSLNVLEPGEVAATAGTSGVIYGVSDQLTFDKKSRVNSFAHVNHTATHKRVGVLLCINGTGILNKWVRHATGNVLSYPQMDALAKTIQPGSDNLLMLPFGNGAERMLNNQIIGSHIVNIDFNVHTLAHLYRAAQEGIAFAFRYGLDIMRENGMSPNVIRAGRANMFLSQVFTEAFVNATGVPVELHDSDGSMGAALGAGIGVKYYAHPSEAFKGRQNSNLIMPAKEDLYNQLYEKWKLALLRQLK